jgi:3D (Asp-Asp-Asp) domain-containing protein
MDIYSQIEHTINEKNKSLILIKKKYDQLRIRYVTVTAYSLSKDECDDNEIIGALNSPIIPNFHCAVSRDLIYMLNKKIYLESIGIFKVKDVMNKRFSEKIDICLENKQICRKFGVKENIKLVMLD